MFVLVCMYVCGVCERLLCVGVSVCGVLGACVVVGEWCMFVGVWLCVLVCGRVCVCEIVWVCVCR